MILQSGKNFANEILFIAGILASQVAYSEIPLACVVLLMAIINRYYMVLVIASLVCSLEYALFMFLHEEHQIRFLQNAYTIAILLILSKDTTIKIGRMVSKLAMAMVFSIAAIKVYEIMTAQVLIAHTNENLIALSLLGLTINRRDIFGTIICYLLAAKAVLVAKMFQLLRFANFKTIILIIGITPFLFNLNFGAVAEVGFDYENSNLNSGRLELWSWFFMNYYYGINYTHILQGGMSNLESFYLNQMISFSYTWPLVAALILRSLISLYKRDMAVGIITSACMVVYPFSQVLLIPLLYNRK